MEFGLRAGALWKLGKLKNAKSIFGNSFRLFGNAFQKIENPFKNYENAFFVQIKWVMVLKFSFINTINTLLCE